MDELIILDPNSEDRVHTSTKEELSAEIRYLFSFSISRYNEAVSAYSEGEIDTAWNNITDSISIFPYTNITVYFGFLLALEIGEYKNASTYLTYLKYFVTESQLSELTNLLTTNINEYNSLLEKPISVPRIDSNTPLIHALIIGLKHPSLRESISYQNIVRNHTNPVPVKDYIYKPIYFRALIYICVVLGITTYLAIYDNQMNKELADQKLDFAAGYSEQLNTDYLHLTDTDLIRKSLNEFFIAFQGQNYEECGNILVNQPQINDIVSQIDPWMLNKVCSGLYDQKKYLLLSSIEYQSSYHIHADYYLLLSAIGEDRRLKKISFIEKYQNSPIYVPPILRELFESEKDIEKRSDYAKRLNLLILKYPDQPIEKYMSREMAVELES